MYNCMQNKMLKHVQSINDFNLVVCHISKIFLLPKYLTLTFESKQISE